MIRGSNFIGLAILLLVVGNVTGVDKCAGQTEDSQSKKTSADKPKPDKKDARKSPGKNCLFIGHSFFIPVAKSFQEQINQSNIPNHSQKSVFAGGINGSPGRLWKNEKKRKQIQEILDTGKVELLGMTYFSPANSSMDDYRKWIDYALEKNPNTVFFIGLPWGLNGPKASMAAYASGNRLGQAVLYEGIVKRLRELYPKSRFYWANYGRVAVELKRAFEKGGLENVEKMMSRNGKNSIFRDSMGHAAPLTLEMASLVWLAVLYDIEPASHPWCKNASEKLKTILTKIAQEEKALNVAPR